MENHTFSYDMSSICESRRAEYISSYATFVRDKNEMSFTVNWKIGNVEWL